MAQNQLVSEGNYFEGEPYLVMHPTNSQHLVAAWMGFQFNNKVVIKTSVSNNGGTTWSTPIWQTHLSPNSQARMYPWPMITWETCSCVTSITTIPTLAMEKSSCASLSTEGFPGEIRALLWISACVQINCASIVRGWSSTKPQVQMPGPFTSRT